MVLARGGQGDANMLCMLGRETGRRSMHGPGRREVEGGQMELVGKWTPGWMGWLRPEEKGGPCR